MATLLRAGAPLEEELPWDGGPSQSSPLPPKCPGGGALGKKDTCDCTHMRSLESSDSQRLESGRWAPGQGEGRGSVTQGDRQWMVGVGARGGMGAGVSEEDGKFWTCIMGTAAQQCEHTQCH